ncbi:MAG: hypothetical protein HDQ87_04875 [Clostridia bacterium]|nr:hypothetical protein [Clostridia bacterium]
MKRKTLLSISVAVLLVVAMSATVFAAADSSVSVSGPGSISTGQTISITVTGTGLGIDGSVSTEGLTVDSVSNQFSSLGHVVLLPMMGTNQVTYTCTVTAGAGETASFAVVDVTAADENDGVFSISGDSWSATVPGGGSDEPEPSASSGTTPSTAPSGQPTGGATNGGSGTGSGSNGGSSTGSGNTDKMPKTGDATMDLWVLAVIAAGCAGAAVVAGKKVFAK